MVGEVLLPYQLHGLDCLGPERWVCLVSGRIVVKLKHVGGTKGLAVKKLEGCFFPGIIDQGGARVCSTAKGRIVVVTKAQIQYEVLAKMNFILSVNGKYV